jgi:hypothetical protein
MLIFVMGRGDFGPVFLFFFFVIACMKKAHPATRRTG